jgi:hypothetical protein
MADLQLFIHMRHWHVCQVTGQVTLQHQWRRVFALQKCEFSPWSFYINLSSSFLALLRHISHTSTGRVLILNNPSVQAKQCIFIGFLAIFCSVAGFIKLTLMKSKRATKAYFWKGASEEGKIFEVFLEEYPI